MLKLTSSQIMKHDFEVAENAWDDFKQENVDSPN
jgi:hypothetical protein